MTKKLNQLLAIEKGLRQQAQTDLTELHRSSQKEELYDGQSREYVPLVDNDERLPAETKIVQQKADDVLEEVKKIQSRVINVVASKDMTNTSAFAAIAGLEDGTRVPVTFLLWLEKTLVDIHTFVLKMPTLDPSVRWKHNDEQDCMATDTIQTLRTKKVLRNHVLAEATKEHPAQVQSYSEDVSIGTWNTIRYSGRLSVDRKNQILNRIRLMQESVKKAREEANLVEVVESKIGDSIMDWLFK